MTSEVSIQTLSFTFENIRLNRFGQVVKRYTSTNFGFEERLHLETSLRMMAVPQMHSAVVDEQPSGPAFYMAHVPITQRQWRQLASAPTINYDLDADPAHFTGDNLPVESVSQAQAQEFCDRLSLRTQRTYRLPTPEEWTHACMAGSSQAFCYGETLSTDWANYDSRTHHTHHRNRTHTQQGTFAAESGGYARQQTTPIGSFGVANRLGLFDLHGNVWEWCQPMPERLQSYGQKPIRGGSWQSPPQACQASFEMECAGHSERSNIGFRVICLPHQRPRTNASFAQSQVTQSVLSNINARDVSVGNITLINNYYGKQHPDS